MTTISSDSIPDPVRKFLNERPELRESLYRYWTLGLPEDDNTHQLDPREPIENFHLIVNEILCAIIHNNETPHRVEYLRGPYTVTPDIIEWQVKGEPALVIVKQYEVVNRLKRHHIVATLNALLEKS